MKLAAALSIAIATLSGAEPNITDAKLETRPLPAGGSLASEVSRASQSSPSWLAWRIATVPNSRQMCCSGDRCAWGCYLGDGNSWNASCATAPTQAPVAHLEESREAFVFVRVEAGQVTRIRTFSPDCQIDAGGLAVTLLNGVPSAATLAFFKTFIHWDSGRLAEHATTALGLLPEPEAAHALEQYLAAAGNLPQRVRRAAAVALGQLHAQQAIPILTRLLKDDPDPKVREDCVYALSLSKPGTAVLLDIANRKLPSDAKMREKAVFWLARSEDPEARRYIETVLSR